MEEAKLQISELLSSMNVESILRTQFLRSTEVDLAIGQLLLTELGQLIDGATFGRQKIRLLIGNNAERLDPTVLLHETSRSDYSVRLLEGERFADRKQLQHRVMRLSAVLRRALGLMHQTEADDEAIRRIMALLDDKRLDVRAFLGERLPTDFLLSRERRGKDIYPSVIYGQGNLLAPLLSGEESFWTRASQPAVCGQLESAFLNRWNNGVPFHDQLSNELRSSWALSTTTPYLLYLSVLHRLVADRLLDSEDLVDDLTWLRGLPSLADFQIVAVQQALTILNQNRGVFIADVVGLGKTYIGTAVLKRLAQQGRRATIFCPPSLVPMWEEMNDRYGLAAVVMSTGRLAMRGTVELNQPKFQTHDRQIVLIDESHRFRNSNTSSYQALREYTHTRSCILLTATPYSLTPQDIHQQIRLFSDDDLDLNLNPPRLSDFFKSVDAGRSSLIDVLRPLLIRRTRKHIQKHYPNASVKVDLPGGGQVTRKIIFPTREKPIIVKYDIENSYGGEGLYDYIVAKLGKPSTKEKQDTLPDLGFEVTTMNYTRYGLYNYVKSDFKSIEPYRDLKQTSVSVRGFIRILLFKRLESSVQAFRKTIDTLLQVHDNFLTALIKGVVPAGDQAQRLLYDQVWTDEEGLLEALSSVDIRYMSHAFQMEEMERDLRNDIDVLAELKALLEPITPALDSKLQSLRALISGTLNTQKVLVFTQFEATARYLSEQLQDIPNVTWLSGQHRSGSGRSFLQTIARFSPKSNPLFADSNLEPIRVLVATDVLSEGLNLQDCSVIINYDLHYNPVRLIQRVGRVDRVGSESESIWIYNFLPEKNVEKVLRIEEVLKRRIKDIHTFVGEDNAILHPDEQINEDDMYAAYTQAPNDEGDEQSSIAVDFTEIEEYMRQLQREKPDLFREIRDLPAGVRSARQSIDGKDGAFLYCATDQGYEELFIVDATGAVRSSKLEEVLAAIECDDSEATLTIPRRYNSLVSKVVSKFEEQASSRQSDRRTGPRLPSGQQFALRHIINLLGKELNEDRRDRLVGLERALRSRLPDAAVRELNRLRRMGLPEDLFRERLEIIYRDLDLGRYIEREANQNAFPAARIICSEALIKPTSA